MTKPANPPFIGAIVHYIDYRGTHIAAIVASVHVDGSTCDLTCFYPYNNLVASTPMAKSSLIPSVGYDASLSNRSWHWPEVPK